MKFLVNAPAGSFDVNRRLADIALDPVGLPPKEFAQFIPEDYEKWGRLIRKLNITID